MDDAAMRPPREKCKVLFVCLGNICRSPAAEIIFRQQVAYEGAADDYLIDSAGTINHHQGSPPDPRMADALKRQGFKVSGRSRKILPDDLENFDLIITMDESNLADVRALDPSGNTHEKIHPFVSFCREHDDLRVPDPYYGGQRGFDHVIELLKDGCAGILAETRK
jgi:protein-tyrosine phosphatase